MSVARKGLVVKLQTRSLVVCFFLLLLSVTKHTPSPDEDYDETVLFSTRAPSSGPVGRRADGWSIVWFALQAPPGGNVAPDDDEQGPLFHCGNGPRGGRRQDGAAGRREECHSRAKRGSAYCCVALTHTPHSTLPCSYKTLQPHLRLDVNDFV